MSCGVCIYNHGYWDGEQLPDGTGYAEWISECRKGNTKLYSKGGKGCKRFKEILVACIGCAVKYPVRELRKGFCCELCKEKYIKKTADEIKIYKKRKDELEKEIKEFKPLNEATYDQYYILTNELYAIEHYLGQSKEILTHYGISL